MSAPKDRPVAPESSGGYQTHCEAWAATFDDQEFVEPAIPEPAPIAEPERPSLADALIPLSLLEAGMRSRVSPEFAEEIPDVAPSLPPKGKPTRRRRDTVGPRLYMLAIAAIGAIFVLSTWRLMHVQPGLAKNQQGESATLAKNQRTESPALTKNQPAESPAVASAKPEPASPPAPPGTGQSAVPQAATSPMPHADASPAMIAHEPPHRDVVAPADLEFIIKNELAQAGFENIGVSADREGDVFLEGELSVPAQEDQVVAIVKDTPGVKNIHFAGQVEDLDY